MELERFKAAAPIAGRVAVTLSVEASAVFSVPSARIASGASTPPYLMFARLVSGDHLSTACQLHVTYV